METRKSAYTQNNANQMRTRILIKIAESYFADKFKNADRIPLELRPKEQQPSRCCIYKDRAVLKYRCMSSLGFSPEEETDELKSLAQYGEEALERTHPERRSSASSTLPVPPASRRSTWLPTPAAAASRVPAR